MIVPNSAFRIPVNGYFSQMSGVVSTEGWL